MSLYYYCLHDNAFFVQLGYEIISVRQNEFLRMNCFVYYGEPIVC